MAGGFHGNRSIQPSLKLKASFAPVIVFYTRKIAVERERVGGRERDRDRDRERQRERQTDRQADRQTDKDKDKDRQTDRQAGRQAERGRGRNSATLTRL